MLGFASFGTASLSSADVGESDLETEVYPDLI